MHDYVDTAVLGTEDRFAIGQPVPRSEDPVLLRGEGHYSDDFNLPGQAYAVIVRSPMAHGLIHKIEARKRVPYLRPASISASPRYRLCGAAFWSKRGLSNTRGLSSELKS